MSRLDVAARYGEFLKAVLTVLRPNRRFRAGQAGKIYKFLKSPCERMCYLLGCHFPAAMTNKANMCAHGNPGSLTAVIFSQHILGLGTRKTSMVFFAEALARQGWKVKFVTVQLSYLSYLVKNPRLLEVPPGDLNAWRCRGENLDNYVWVPPVHPATLPIRLLNSASGFLARLYPLLLHHSIRKEAARANMVIIESCAAIALFSKLKTIARNAKFVYFCNDRLSAIGMHPVLQKILTQTAPHYDLVRTNSTDLLKDFLPHARAEYIPQGLDKRSFDIPTTSPYEDGTTNIVIAGDMAFDTSAVKAVLECLPDVDIHAFGRNRQADLLPYPRFHHHGEVAFSSLLPYIRHADAGFAPYSARPGMDYLAESSLKLIQYSYAGLPIIAPYFAKGGRAHVFTYDPVDPPAAALAASQALSFDRTLIKAGDIPDWDDVATRLLGRLAQPTMSVQQ